MKLYYYCSSCQKENSFTTKATNRFELQEERGNEINERCTYCGTVNKRHVNRVHAKANTFNMLIGGVLGLLVTVILALIIPKIALFFIAGTIFSLPYLAWRSEEKKASTFNRVLIED